jgi:hypothetical protein
MAPKPGYDNRFRVITNGHMDFRPIGPPKCPITIQGIELGKPFVALNEVRTS